MRFYEDLVMQTQMDYSRHYNLYASGRIPYALVKKPEIPYEEQIGPAGGGNRRSGLCPGRRSLRSLGGGRRRFLL